MKRLLSALIAISALSVGVANAKAKAPLCLAQEKAGQVKDISVYLIDTGKTVNIYNLQNCKWEQGPFRFIKPADEATIRGVVGDSLVKITKEGPEVKANINGSAAVDQAQIYTFHFPKYGPDSPFRH